MRMRGGFVVTAIYIGAAVCAGASAGSAGAQEKYQVPPKGIVDLVDVLPTPAVSVSPAAKGASAKWAADPAALGAAADFRSRAPELRLAGLRFNPKDEWAEPRALRDGHEPEGAAGRERNSGHRVARHAENAVWRSGRRTDKNRVCEYQRRKRRRGAHAVDRRCRGGARAASEGRAAERACSAGRAMSRASG